MYTRKEGMEMTIEDRAMEVMRYSEELEKEFNRWEENSFQKILFKQLGLDIHLVSGLLFKPGGERVTLFLRLNNDFVEVDQVLFDYKDFLIARLTETKELRRIKYSTIREITLKSGEIVKIHHEN